MFYCRKMKGMKHCRHVDGGRAQRSFVWLERRLPWKNLHERLPIAEAALTLFNWICQDDFFDDVFEKYQGHPAKETSGSLRWCGLVADALLQHQESDPAWRSLFAAFLQEVNGVSIRSGA